MNDIILFLLVKTQHASVFLAIASGVLSSLAFFDNLDAECQTEEHHAACLRVLRIASISFLLFGALAVFLPSEEEAKTYLKQKQ